MLGIERCRDQPVEESEPGLSRLARILDATLDDPLDLGVLRGIEPGSPDLAEARDNAELFGEPRDFTDGYRADG
jgi:hypothetical protein